MLLPWLSLGAEAGSDGDTRSLELGGALRFNAVYRAWDEASRVRGGDLEFDTLRLNTEATWDALLLSAEYRFYAGYQMLHHGFLGYAFSERMQVDVGVSQVPFGLLPFASHNWFFSLPYYVGLEDDYDLGVRGHLSVGRLDLWLAFFKNDEGSYLGRSIDSARYSYDIVSSSEDELGERGPLSLQEANQLNARLAWKLSIPDDGVAELGVSGRVGQLVDAATLREGHHWAAAGHLDVRWRRFNLQLEWLQYLYRPPDPFGGSPFVVMGAYDAPYKVARRAMGVVANLAYRIPLDAGVFESVTLYENFTWLAKQVTGAIDSSANVLGALVEAGPIFAFFDAVLARNHPFAGPGYTNSLAEGDGATWHLRMNTNLGWYF